MTIQDEAMSDRVSNAIMQDKRIGGQPIAVRVAQGEASLKGLVDTEEQRELAIIVASGVAGVRRVNAEELRVREASQ